MTHSFPTRRSADLRVKNARAAQSQLRVIETVVRAALFDNPDAVARVMKVANDKVRTHLQAGRQFQAAKVRDTSVRAVEPSGRNRQEPGKEQIGRAHVCTPVTNAQHVCRLLLLKKKH